MKENPQRWGTLLAVSAAQLLVVLDGTIINIALPSAQRALGMSDAGRQWAITAYALAFGGLLLIGGRISGALGHRRTFIIGLLGFAASSALGGAATTPELLFAARALQGVFAAGLAPAGLSLLTITFTGERERGRAFGVFAAVGAAGSALGLVAGGLLTDYVSWRWCLYINVPVALLAVLGTALVTHDRPKGSTSGLDVPGALLSASGFAAVVYAFNEAESHGWSSAKVLALLTAGVLLLAAFVVVELRTTHPLLPMRILLHRARGGAFLSITLLFVAMFGFYLFMSYYTQTVLGYSPVEAGLTLIIHAVAALLASTLIAGRLHGRVPPSALVLPGLLAAAAGMLLLTRLAPTSTDVFTLYLVPAMVLTGVGIGLVMPPTAALATAEMPWQDIGSASAAYNASQQLGAALGTALLNTVAASAAASYLAAHPQTVPTAPIIHGYTTALTIAFTILLTATLLTAPLLLARRSKHRPNEDLKEKPPTDRDEKTAPTT